jgi:hypothetical protein
VPAQNSSVQIKVTFPGTVVQTDGVANGATVVWTLKPGQVNTFGSTAQYGTGGGQVRSWTFWATMIGAAGALIALFLVGLALLARRRNMRKDQAPNVGY